MSYSIENFIKPISSSKNIQILDIKGILKYSIKPTVILDVIDDLNILKIVLKTKEIKLDFPNISE